MRVLKFEWVIVCVACGGGEAEPAPDPTAPLTTVPGATEPNPVSAASNSASGGTPAVSPLLPAAPSAALRPVMPGTPQVLADDLTHATRIALDGSDVLVLHHPEYAFLDPEVPSEILRVPSTGGPASVVVSAPQLTGFVVDGSTLWAVAGPFGVAAFDLSTGEEQLRVPIDSTSYAFSIAQSDTHVFAMVMPSARLLRVDKASGSTDVLHSVEVNASPQWLIVQEGAVYFLADSAQSSTEVDLVGVPLDGSGAGALARLPPSVALGVAGDELVTGELGSGMMSAISQTGSVRALGVVTDPWAIAADADFVYVASQPTDVCPLDYVGTVSKIPLAGGPTTLLADGLACPSMLIAATDALYWVNNGYSEDGDDGFESLGGGSLMRLVRQ